jgi:hypothetical protein
MGDAFTSSFTGVPFANGNTTVSLQRVVSRVVIPNLHVSATGSSLGGPGGGISTSSAGSDSFSDRLSVTEAQLDAVNKAIGSHYGDIFVKLKYLVTGAVMANNHGIADGEFDVSVAGASGTVVGDQGGQVTASPNGNTDTLLGKMFVCSRIRNLHG